MVGYLSLNSDGTSVPVMHISQCSQLHRTLSLALTKSFSVSKWCLRTPDKADGQLNPFWVMHNRSAFQGNEVGFCKSLTQTPQYPLPITCSTILRPSQTWSPLPPLYQRQLIPELINATESWSVFIRGVHTIMQAKSGTTYIRIVNAPDHLINVVSLTNPSLINDGDEPAVTRLNNIVFGNIRAFYDLFTPLE